MTNKVVAGACWDDLCRSFCCLSWAFSLQIQASIHSCLLTLRALVSTRSGAYVSLNSYPCEGASWSVHAGVVPTYGVATETSLLSLNLHRLLTNLQGTKPQDHHEFKLRESLWNPPFGIQCLLLSHPLSFPHLLLTLSKNKQTNKNDHTILTRGDIVYYINFVQHEQLPHAFFLMLRFLASIHQLPEVVLEQIPHLEPIARGIY